MTGSSMTRAVAALCSCNLASYPGDGVTVGGAALAGISEAHERHRSGDGAACVKSFHIVPPGADAADACVAADAKFAADDRDFKASQRDQRICSGVSLGEPLPLASALLISVTIRRDNGTCSLCLSAMAVMTPCR